MSRIRESRTWRFHCNLYIFNLYKMPRFGGPVVSSTSSGKTKLSTSNSMSCIREGRTWTDGGFHCILYMCNLYKMPRFGGPAFSSALTRKANFSSLNSMSRIREGRTWRIHCNLYICNQVFKNKAYLGEQILRRNFIEPFVVKTSSVYL